MLLLYLYNESRNFCARGMSHACNAFPSYLPQHIHHLPLFSSSIISSTRSARMTRDHPTTIKGKISGVELIVHETRGFFNDGLSHLKNPVFSGRSRHSEAPERGTKLETILLFVSLFHKLVRN